MPLMEHLIELRQRLMKAMLALLLLFFVCFYFAGDIYQFLIAPLHDIAPGKRMIYTALHEAFFTQIKVAFFAALFLGFPVIAGQIWMFVAPGLYQHEKKAFMPFLVATPILFFLGGALVYYFVIPMAWQFFLGFETAGGDATMAIELEAKVNEYLSLVMRLIFAFGLCFELPVLMTLLGRIGVVTSKGMAEKRRYAIVAAFVAAAILTPPDVISQIGLAIPTILLYEISIISVRMVEKGREEATDDDGDDDDDPDGADDDDDDADKAAETEEDSVKAHAKAEDGYGP